MLVEGSSNHEHSLCGFGDPWHSWKTQYMKTCKNYPFLRKTQVMLATYIIVYLTIILHMQHHNTVAFSIFYFIWICFSATWRSKKEKLGKRQLHGTGYEIPKHVELETTLISTVAWILKLWLLCIRPLAASKSCLLGGPSLYRWLWCWDATLNLRPSKWGK